MRLINVDKLIDAVRQHEIGLEKDVVEVYEAFIELFEVQPTAFDVDAVLEELEKQTLEYQQYFNPKHDYEVGYEEGCEFAFYKAIEIVRNGGVKNE